MRDQFWIPQPKIHGVCYFIFCKTSKRACLASFQVLISFYLASIFELKIDVLVSRTRVTSVYLVHGYRFSKITEEIYTYIY